MCIIFIKTNPNPKKGELRLIIAANRDEFYRRPAREAYMCSESKIIGGRDLQENREEGMWLGIKINREKETFKMGALLNVTGEDRNTDVHSRGFIVPGYLESEESSIVYFDNFMKDKKFNAFNLVNVELSKKGISAYFLSNTPYQICEFPGEQTLGFGNSPVNRPLTKVQNGRIRFDEITKNCESKEELRNNLIKFLKSSEKNLPDPELEWRAPQAFEYLSSIYVAMEQSYGTRTHTVILVDDEWNIEFYEDTMESPIDADNIVWKNKLLKSSL